MGATDWIPTYTVDSIGTATSTGIYYTNIYPSGGAWQSDPTPLPERYRPPKTNLDWLRERVDEMRVSMADFGCVQ